MRKNVLEISEEDFNYLRYEPKIYPSVKRLCSYNSFPEELVIGDNGSVLNPFIASRNKASRFVCFEALRRDVSFEQLTNDLALNTGRESSLLKELTSR